MRPILLTKPKNIRIMTLLVQSVLLQLAPQKALDIYLFRLYFLREGAPFTSHYMRTGG